MKMLVAALLLATLACRNADQRPRAIESEDACARCKMTISQPRYAAQIVEKDGTSYKFDDIGCMVIFARQHQLTRAAGAKMYVMDYAATDWLDAERAVFVKSDAIDSPMASGLAAFRDQSTAQKSVVGNSGRMLDIKDVMSSSSDDAHPAQ